MATRMSKMKWTFLYIFSGGMDFIQFVVIECILVWFFGVGVAINEVLDPIVGGAILLFLQFIGGVNMLTKVNRVLSLIGTEAAAGLTGGIAQLWILDVWYIHSTVKAEEAEEQAQKDQQAMLQAGGDGPLYQNGVGKPRGNGGAPSGPVNKTGKGGRGMRPPKLAR